MSLAEFLLLLVVLVNLWLVFFANVIYKQIYWFAWQTDHNLMHIQSQLLQLRGQPSPMPDPDLSGWNKPVPGPGYW